MIGDKPTNTTPLQKLRAALHDKAKSAPNFRFYSLYDKVYRRDVLEAAWRQCRANGGAPGVDSQTFADIEEYGLGRWLDELTDTRIFEVVHKHACRRVRRWLRRKFAWRGMGYRHYPDSRLERELGLLNLRRFPRRYSWATS